jgi:aspartate/methionine/tyrosine aminotransferase
MTEVLPTVGASEAIYATIHALIDPGEEVIIMQPFYDSYPAAIRLAGGVPVTVSIAPPTGAGTGADGIPSSTPRTAQDWRLDMSALRCAITPRTRMLILNNPHNPSGKVFTRAELLEIAAIAEAHDLLVLADEVYETLTYDPASPMIKFASLPGMYQRTITVGSAGKMFG